MNQGTAPKAPPADQADPRPLDIATMRDSANRMLANSAPLPSYDDLQTVILLLRGHLMLLVPEVEVLASRLPDDDVLGKVARAGVSEARRHLDELPSSNLPRAVGHAQRLARSVEALCTHVENLAVSR